jgi:hypothetical protein
LQINPAGRCYGCGRCDRCARAEIDTAALLRELNADPVWVWLRAEAFYLDDIALAKEAREFTRADNKDRRAHGPV